MKISVRIDKLNTQPDSAVKAFVSVTLDGAFAVHGLRVLEGKNGLYVGMPNNGYINKNGVKQYSDVFHPITGQAREAIQNAVLQAYTGTMAQAAEFSYEQAEDPVWA